MSPQTGSFVGLTFTAISRAQQFEILLDALWNVQKIFESNFSIIVLTHFCSLTGMMFVDVSNVGGVGFVQEVYYRRQDVCNLYGDVGWLRHYLSGPAQCNIWELNSAVFFVGNNMCSVTLSPVIRRDPSTTGNQVMAIIAIMLMIFQSTSKLEL